MGTYDNWNKTLVSFFTGGYASGTAVFLSVDEDTLRAAGRTILTAQLGTDAVTDFLGAVRHRVVRGGYRVNVASLHGHGPDGIPDGVAFLCATVLAASRMANQGDTSELNYFRRLREVFGLEHENGRPPGMEPGSEEPLWEAWNQYLRRQNFIPTARRGSDEPHKFINYPISQALLRRVDKDRLFRLFADKGWKADWDAETLLARVRQESGRLSLHFRVNLLNGEGDRLLAAMDAVHELYNLWKESPDLAQISLERVGYNKTIMSGLMRISDPFWGTISYYLYPRAPRRRGIEHIVVQEDAGERSLRLERPGWFETFKEVSETEINEGCAVPILDPVELSQVIFPKRDFWILVPDPEDPDSGVYASWARPPLGTPFLILCRDKILPQLHLLRTERLIEFVGDPEPVMTSGHWFEIRHCMVVASTWSGVFVENRELAEMLRPITTISIGLQGGLRLPHDSGWLCDHGPEVTAFGFETEVSVSVIDNRETCIYQTSCKANVPLQIPWETPGHYRIEARTATSVTERAVWIRDWADLSLAEGFERQYVTFGPYRVSGALLERQDGSPL